MDILNRKIVKIYQGKWEASEGVDMPGVAGPTWYYSNVFLQLDNGLILCVSVGEELEVIEKLPKNSKQTNEQELKKLQGKRSIINIYHSDVDLIVYVLFDDGSHLEYSYQPGGSDWTIDRFDDWSKDDIGGEDENETYTSLIDGKSVTWMQLVKWYNK